MKRLKFVTWNVNGIYSRISSNFFEYVHNSDADFICIQELRVRPEKFFIVNPDQYDSYVNTGMRPGYSGTAVYYKYPPLAKSNKMPVISDEEGRIIVLEYEKFFLINVYAPHSKNDLSRLNYRLMWDLSLRSLVRVYDKRKPVILCGDLNVAHRYIDLSYPERRIRAPGFTNEEKTSFNKLLSAGFIDTFKLIYPTKEDSYIYWLGRRTRSGIYTPKWRLDYFIISERLRNNVESIDIIEDQWGSDHSPVELIIHI